MIYLPIESIVEEGINPQEFVAMRWVHPVRTTYIKVLVKDQVVDLMPALKIETGTPVNKIVQAFDLIEQKFMDAVKLRRDPETSYLRILQGFPHRISKNAYFEELDPNNPRPKFK